MYKATIEVDIPSPDITLSESEAWARMLERIMLEGLDYFDEATNYYHTHECEEQLEEYKMEKIIKLDKILNQRRQLIKKLIKKIRKLQGKDAQ